MSQYFYLKSTDVKDVDVSNILKQYLEIKYKHQDSVVFFRIGEFYEAYFEDAFLLSKICSVHLTKRDAGKNKAFPMAGIPVGTCDIHIQKLLDAKYKVAICEQDSSEKCSKTGLIKRRIIRKYSPGTLCDSEFLASDSNNYICAVLQMKDDFGLSYCDVSTGELFVTQGGLNEILLEISKINPAELLAPIKTRELETFKVVAEEEADLDEKITFEFVPTLISRSYFGNNLIKPLEGYELGSRCANAILTYVYETQQDFAPKLENVQTYDVYEYLLMNENTRKNLELVKNLSDGKKYGSLFWAIDKTKTVMGKRLLKKWIIQPLRNIEKITERQDAVDELIENPDSTELLDEQLDRCYDILRLCAKISNNTAGVKDFLALRDTLLTIKSLRGILQKFKNPFLNFLGGNFSELEDFSTILKDTILDEPNNSIREGNIIKSGVSAELDYLRGQLSEEKNWLKEYSQKEQARIKGVKVTSNRIIGYFIEVPSSKVSKVPENYHIKQNLSNCSRYYTEELRECEDKINLLSLKINELEYDIFVKIRDYAKELVGDIRSLAHFLAQLDVLCSFCKCALEDGFVRPKVLESDVFEILKGRHPSVEKLCGEFTPNSINLSKKKFILLTGPNMVGKSTYLRQNAIIAILAQMGSFVPASFVRLAPVDKIFTRMGAVDDLINNNSTFMVEMLEVKAILSDATSKSLILLDEVGKNTSTKDGVAIARAVSEFIIEKIGAKTIFATHYHKLAYLEEKYDCVENFMIGASQSGTFGSNFSRCVEKGFLDKSYGINIAKMAGLPDNVIEKAQIYIMTPS